MNKIILGADRNMMPPMELKSPLQNSVQDPVQLFSTVDSNYMKYNSISMLDFNVFRVFKSSFNYIVQTHLPTMNNFNKLVISLSFAAGNLLCIIIHTFCN